MKHLQYYLDQTGDAARKAKYAGFISAQSSGVVHYATGSNGVRTCFRIFSAPVNKYTCNQQPGNVWYAGSQGGSHTSTRTVASGLEAHIAEVAVSDCPSNPSLQPD